MPNDKFLALTRPIDHDQTVDQGIRDCLEDGSTKNFITFAGAGSGKTYSLKEALEYLKDKHEEEFCRKGTQIAVITFTNNAVEEIADRIERASVFSISTVHSFCWRAIEGFNEDIRKWYLEEIPDELAELNEKERRGRAGMASDARKRRIARLTQKIEWLSQSRTFVYDPSGINSSENSLSHTDVLKIFACFLESKPMMAEVLFRMYPYIFIDESQDTDKGVINALFSLQKEPADAAVIGLFGDTMQRIFGGGEPELGKTLPKKWVEFDKQMNHRSARRIVGLGNRIRLEDDGRSQFAREGAETGIARFFILSQGTENKDVVEEGIRSTMADCTGDVCWKNTEADETAILLLEHKMVGRRLGFDKLWNPLSKVKRVADRMSEGKSSELNFFSTQVLPLAEACIREDKFETLTILRASKSVLLEEQVFDDNPTDPLSTARQAEQAFKDVISAKDVTFHQVLKTVAEHRLLPIPAKLKLFIDTSEVGEKISDSEIDENSSNQITSDQAEEQPDLEADEIDAWAEALNSPFFQIKLYRDYVSENSIYRTHQGVKGNEFERVMVIMDDDEAGGFMFSYEQYFGAKEPSAGTIAKIEAGEETGWDRTRRLFYVTSTRAKSSLAHVIYTSDPAKVKQNLIDRKLAEPEEIILL